MDPGHDERGGAPPAGFHVEFSDGSHLVARVWLSVGSHPTTDQDMPDKELQKISGIGSATARRLSRHGIASLVDLAAAPLEQIMSATGMPRSRAKVLQTLANRSLGKPPAPADPAPRSTPVVLSGNGTKSDNAARFFDRELSWLAFARRVLEQVRREDLPLLERVKFAGIMGMLHDEFTMKRVSGLKRLMAKGKDRPLMAGLTVSEILERCRTELLLQSELLHEVILQQLMPALAHAGIAIHTYDELPAKQKKKLRRFFRDTIMPVLTPLAVDAEHPFPFISNLGLNLGVLVPQRDGGKHFVRIKVPGNRTRWVPVDDGGFVPLEQVIAANLDLLFPSAPSKVQQFRVTRAADGDPVNSELTVEEALREPGSIVRQVSGELKARRFAGVVRLEVDDSMPAKRVKWLGKQLGIEASDIYPTPGLLGLNDLMSFDVEGHDVLRLPKHRPVVNPRLRDLDRRDPGAIFDAIRSGDILVHHPYHSFDSSVLRFLESAAEDPHVLAIKLTIYRTSQDSPIIQALAEAARRGKQVAVLVEITARFDEAPNIAWGQYLEREGAHVAYGVESLKTHVKLALVVREEKHGLQQYLHVGTGNYHSGTARIYEDIGLFTCDPDLTTDAGIVFNALTGSMPLDECEHILVAPSTMRKRFVELIRREAKHARAGRTSGIRAKMNQLQDPELIEELYEASQAGVPISLNIRGVCILRPGVPGLSDNIKVFSVVGRFLEHSRLYRFENDGDARYFLGSADWMKRNLDRRIETIAPVRAESTRAAIDLIFETYDRDNTSAWDCQADGSYVRRQPTGDEVRAAQDVFRRAALLDGTPSLNLTPDGDGG